MPCADAAPGFPLLASHLQEEGRPGSTSFDPTVRNLQLSSSGLEGYRHAVKAQTLNNLDLPAGLGRALEARHAAAEAARAKVADEAEEDGLRFDLGGDNGGQEGCGGSVEPARVRLLVALRVLCPARTSLNCLPPVPSQSQAARPTPTSPHSWFA